jgi:hypothetical protein
MLRAPALALLGSDEACAADALETLAVLQSPAVAGRLGE